MPSASRASTPVSVDLDMIEGRYVELGDQTVAFETYRQDLDAAPFFRSLPGDACTCTHRGYVTAGRATTPQPGGALRLAETFVRWLETGERQPDLYADDLFVDLTLPHWRLQGEGGDAAFLLREQSHPVPGAVTVSLLEPTPRGFVMSFEERWDAGASGGTAGRWPTARCRTDGSTGWTSTARGTGTRTSNGVMPSRCSCSGPDPSLCSWRPSPPVTAGPGPCWAGPRRPGLQATTPPPTIR